MIIEKVELENFKSHVNSSANFSKGVNLIVGENGSGKSSILQSIGLALFGSRKGPFRNQSRFITNFNDSENARIKITLVANDEMRYTLIKEISGGSPKWELISEDGRLFQSAELSEKVKEILGVSFRDPEKVYEQVITAHQNMMTGTFLNSANERKSFFNDLFGTNVYKELYSSETKEYEKNLQVKKERELGRKEFLESETEKIPRMEEELADLRESLKKVFEDGELLSKKRIEKRTVLDSLKKAKEDHERSLVEVNHLGKAAADFEAEAENSEKRHENSMKAEKICLETIDARREYLALEKKQEALSEELAGLETLPDRKNAMERAVQTAKAKMEWDEKNSESKRKDAKRLSEENEGIDRENEGYSKEMAELGKNLSEKTEGLRSLSSLLEKIRSSGNELAPILDMLWMIEANRKDLSSEVSEDSEYEKKAEELKISLESGKPSREELLRKRERMAELGFRKEDLEKSKEQLSGGMCPFLKEKCLNVSQKGDPSSYFDPKIKDLEEERKTLSGKIERLEAEMGVLENIERELERITAERKENEAKTKKIEDLDGQKRLASAEAGRIINELNAATGAGIPFSTPRETKKALSELVEGLREKAAGLNAEKAQIEEKISSLERAFEKNEGRKTENARLIEECEKSVSKNSADISVKKEEITRLEEKIAGISPSLRRLEELRTKRTELSKKMRDLKPSSDLYIQNRNAANQVERTAEDLRKATEKRNRAAETLKRALEASERLSKLRDDSKMDEMYEEIKGIESDIERTNKRIGETEAGIKTAGERLKELESKKNDLEKVKGSIEFIDKKLSLTAKFRNLLNTMGPEVASQYRNHIAVKSTEKYRELTEKVDLIRWDEDYSLFLISNFNGSVSERSFDLLSGGEQMIVALAVRSALAETFSGAKFAIFDEPTVNLDEERRQALSEMLPKLFSEMEQVIVVTHDNAFREMTEKIVQVKKIDGVSVVTEGE